MKKIIILIGIIVMIIAARYCFGQQAEGVITYEVTTNMHRNLPPDRQDMKAMIPEFRVTKQQLFFNADASHYKPLLEDDDDELENHNGSGGPVRMVFRQRVEVYTAGGKTISVMEFLGKDYLVDDSVKMQPWKFGTETKTIAGYECKQAFYTDEERKQTVTAWFTDKLRPFLGPDRTLSLPGAILAVDINNGERVTVAKKIELRPMKKNDVREPTKGAHITQADFRKMVEEHAKQTGGRIIIR